LIIPFLAVGRSPAFLVASANFVQKTAKDTLAFAKAKPWKLLEWFKNKETNVMLCLKILIAEVK